MFIRKKHYRRLLAEMAELRGIIVATRNDETAVLFGFAEDIGKLQDAVSDFSEIADMQKDAYVTQLKRDVGFQNMMNY